MANQNRPGPIRALDCPRGAEYDEEAFMYFLGLEQARAARSKHPLPVLLATIEPIPGQPVSIPHSDAARLFESLRQSLRDTDVMGWYRQGRVAGAVLSARNGILGTAISAPIEQRVGDGLRQRLPAKLARCLHVRVVQQGPRRFNDA